MVTLTYMLFKNSKFKENFMVNLPLPFGLLNDHLNLVLSVSNGPAVEQFYGDILDLERMSDVHLPDQRRMIRYRVGASELKFIVTSQNLLSMEGGLSNARGIRKLALLLPYERRSGIIQRMMDAGIEIPEFAEDNMGLLSSSRGLTKDDEGNHVEIIFLNDESLDLSFSKLQIGLAVSNISDMGDFLHEVLELDPANIEADIHRYDLGQTQIQLWEVSKTMPKWVGRPHEMLGMTMVQFVVNDVYAARETIVERGGTIHLEPYVLGDLGVVMFAEGPDGILFEFAASLVK